MALVIVYDAKTGVKRKLHSIDAKEQVNAGLAVLSLEDVIEKDENAGDDGPIEDADRQEADADVERKRRTRAGGKKQGKKSK